MAYSTTRYFAPRYFASRYFAGGIESGPVSPEVALLAAISFVPAQLVSIELITTALAEVQCEFMASANISTCAALFSTIRTDPR